MIIDTGENSDDGVGVKVCDRFWCRFNQGVLDEVDEVKGFCE